MPLSACWRLRRRFNNQVIHVTGGGARDYMQMTREDRDGTGSRLDPIRVGEAPMQPCGSREVGRGRRSDKVRSNQNRQSCAGPGVQKMATWIGGIYIGPRTPSSCCLLRLISHSSSFSSYAALFCARGKPDGDKRDIPPTCRISHLRYHRTHERRRQPPSGTNTRCGAPTRCSVACAPRSSAR